VAATVTETPRVRTLVLDLDAWPGHRAGQHVDVRLTAEDGYQAERSYSIASPPGEPVAIAVERLDGGEVSPYLVDEVRDGDRFELRGPIGGYFVWDGGDAPVLLVAGGSGIVPLMALVRHRLRGAGDAPFRLLYSSRTWDEVIYRDELERIGGGGVGVEVVHTLTRAQPEGWRGYARRVDARLLREVVWPPANGVSAFVCGPTSFVERVADLLVGEGYEPRQVRTERFGG
jgi:ferredoxin-NADP reductase